MINCVLKNVSFMFVHTHVSDDEGARNDSPATCNTRFTTWIDHSSLFVPVTVYPFFFRGWTSVRKNRKYSSLVKDESKIRENKNLRIAKIAQTRELGDREKKNRYTAFRVTATFSGFYCFPNCL